MPPWAFPARLYPIVDTLGDPQRSHVALARAVLDGGAPLLQLRVKDQPTRRFVEIARAVQALAAGAGAQLIINDRPDIAQLVDAAGVHVGQTDVPPIVARQILGPSKIIGYSTHTRAQAEAAFQDGVADYVAFGPMYTTSSKQLPDPVQGLDALRAVCAHAAVPVVAIGGITATTMHAVLAAGADAVAMIGAIVQAPDVSAAVGELLRAMQPQRGSR